MNEAKIETTTHKHIEYLSVMNKLSTTLLTHTIRTGLYFFLLSLINKIICI